MQVQAVAGAVRHRLLPRVHFDQQVLSLQRTVLADEGRALRSLLSLLSARYSRGDDLTALKPVLAAALACDTEMQDWKSMVGPATWLPAFALFCWTVCLGTRDQQMHLIERLGPTDRLLDGMAVLVVPGRPVASPDELQRQWKRDQRHPYYGELFLPKRFAALYDALLEPDAAAATNALHQYLKGWYVGSGAAADKADLQGVGAWCIEAAALVQLRRLDDAALRAHPNYPADLAPGSASSGHQRRAAPPKTYRRAPGAPRDPQGEGEHFSALIARQQAELQRTHADRLQDARAKAQADPASLTLFESWTLRREEIRGADAEDTDADSAGAAQSLLRQWLAHLEARYSQGEALDALRPVYDNAVLQLAAADAAHRRAYGDDATQALFAHGRFLAQPLREACQLLAFALAYGDVAGTVATAQAIVRGEALTDTLADALVHHLGDRAPHTPALRVEMVDEGLWLEFPHVYGPLWDCLQAPAQDRPARLAAWLAEWPERARDFGGWQPASRREYYAGLWCWEAMVFARLLAIDDSALREVRFYPGDLAAQAALQTGSLP